MSFDLAVWHSSKSWTTEEVAERYVALCAGKNIIKLIEPHKKVSKFVAELTAIYPQIDDVAEDKVDDCPWNCAFDVSAGHCIMSMSFSRADEVAPIIIRLARKYGLICYDPQDEKAYLPSRLRSKSPRRKARKTALITVKVIKHIRPFNFRSIDLFYVLNRRLKGLKTPIPFREQNVEVTYKSLDPRVYGDIDELHVFKSAYQRTWKFSEFLCKNGFIEGMIDTAFPTA